MCGVRRMPRTVNNCCVIIAPAVPIQAGACGGGMSNGFAPVMQDMNCMPNNVAMCNPNSNATMCEPVPNTAMFGSVPNATVPNAAIANNFVPSGTMPGGNLSGFTCNANFETTQRCMESPLQCAPTIIHHHNRVQHMVPCIRTNIHHVHNHHEWLPFEQREVNEVVNHSHGVRPSDLDLCNSIR